MPPSGITDYTYAVGETGDILNTDNTNTLPYLDVTQVSGLDTAPVRLNTTEREGTDGTYVDALFSSMRTIVITGNVYANVFDADSFCEELKAQFSSPFIQPLYFKHPGKAIKFVVGQGGGAQYDIDNNRRLGVTPIQLTYLCGDPYIYDFPANFAAAAPQNPLVTGLNFNNQVNFLTGTNVDFETSIGNWTNANLCTIARSTAQSHGGAASLAITATGAGNMFASSCTPASIATQGFPVSPGDIVTSNSWTRANTVARTCQMGTTYYDINGTVIGSATFSAGVANTTTGWTQIFGTQTAPANAVWGRVNVQAVGVAGAGEIHFVDDVFVSVNGLGFPIGFGDQILPSVVSVTNSGTRTAYPIIQLYGPLQNIVLTDSASNLTMRLPMTLLSTDSIVIDCRNKQITLNGTNTIRSTYKGRRFFSVPAGIQDTFFLHTDAIGGSYSVTLYNTYY